MVTVLNPRLERRLRTDVNGDVLFDAAGRGRYATDASHYQMMPLGVVVPRTMDDALSAMTLAIEEGVPVTARGGGTSQCGQTINSGLVIDGSKYLDRLLDLDVASRTCRVQPGIVLDDLNRLLKPHGLWFPVDVSTASRATIGGMAGNNSCGGRSLRYGTMRDNVIAIDAVLADGTDMRFAQISTRREDKPTGRAGDLVRRLMAIGEANAEEVTARFPKVQRRVGGYNIDALVPQDEQINLAHILVGSEGTLAYSKAIDLKLWPLLGRRALGVCHFGSFHAAMDAAQHLVTLKPIAVELVDATMIGLASEIAMFRPTLQAVVRGEPAALLLVEFAEDDAENTRRLKQLSDLMGDLGFGFDQPGARFGGVVEVLDPTLQAAITDLRTSGLNIMMSMKESAKPVSFVEDCAVPLEHLAEYTARLTSVFEKHGTRGTWYAHASEGCLHVRPLLNLRLEKDVKAMRAIAEEAFDLVRAYKGSHSGEHGDGLVRSEFHLPMFGQKLVRAFEDVKDLFDPKGLMNPGKIVRAPRFDDHSLLRYQPSYAVKPFETQLDWSAYPGEGGGFQGAVEMCNNNGACRKLQGGAMCPSFRATREEVHVTRGRANTLRLAISGQIGAIDLASDEIAQSMELCVSCKACQRECPTGVDMARMKIEVLAARLAKRGMSMRDRLFAGLPRYAPMAARIAPLLNLRNRSFLLRWASDRLFGLSSTRDLPVWRRDRFKAPAESAGPANGREVVLWADSFNSAFEPENLRSAIKVLAAAGYRTHVLNPTGSEAAPLCCGRTRLAVGDVAGAKRELSRTLAAFAPFAERGIPLIGLEPSCLFTFRDELQVILPGPQASQMAQLAILFEEFVATEMKAGRFSLPMKHKAQKALLHGHCHQKAFGAMGEVETVLRSIPGLGVSVIDSGCCGMAGAFGYQTETANVSRAMAELSLLPAVRKAEAEAVIVADGTSCRHQIAEGSDRTAVHVVRLMADRLDM